MKRDMDLVKKILLNIESSEPLESLTDIQIDGYDKNTINAHCELLYCRNLIKEFNPINAYGGMISASVSGLTWEGYDFLEAIRNDSKWNETKEIIKNKGLPMAIETIMTISKEFVSAASKGAVSAFMNGGM